jgi:hypothetical protein
MSLNYQGGLCDTISLLQLFIKSQPLMIHISYFPSIIGFEILLQNLHGCSNFQYLYSLCLSYTMKAIFIFF